MSATERVLHKYGDETGTPIHIRITSSEAARRIALDPDLNLGEAFMDGGVELDLAASTICWPC